LKQATEFDRLAELLGKSKTERDKMLFEVARGLSRVCELLAQIAEERGPE